MQYVIEINGRSRTVVIDKAGDGFAVAVDGRTRRVDAVRIDAHTLSLLIDLQRVAGDAVSPAPRGGHSYELIVTPEPTGRFTVQTGAASVSVGLNRGRRGKAEARGGEGPQRLVAPMPGRVVRIVAVAGEIVRARQPLIVIEAMKMENELRALADGTVAEIHVSPGASVEAGTPLIDIR